MSDRISEWRNPTSIYLVVFFLVLSRVALLPLQPLLHQLYALHLHLQDVESRKVVHRLQHIVLRLAPRLLVKVLILSIHHALYQVVRAVQGQGFCLHFQTKIENLVAVLLVHHRADLLLAHCHQTAQAQELRHLIQLHPAPHSHIHGNH